MSGSYVSDDLRDREDNVIRRVRWGAETARDGPPKSIIPEDPRPFAELAHLGMDQHLNAGLIGEHLIVHVFTGIHDLRNDAFMHRHGFVR